MRKARVSKAIKPKLWYRELNRAQRGKQPSGREVTFSRHHNFVGMSVYEGGRMISHTCRRYPWATNITEAENERIEVLYREWDKIMFVRDTDHRDQRRESNGDCLFA